MLPNIGLNVGNLPVVGEILGNDNGAKADGVAAKDLGKVLEKVAEKNPAALKDLAFALSEAGQSKVKDSDDGKMPKELEGLLKGALDIAAGMIPGGNIIKGVLAKIF